MGSLGFIRLPKGFLALKFKNLCSVLKFYFFILKRMGLDGITDNIDGGGL